MASKSPPRAVRIALRTTLILVVGICVGCDHATKLAATTRLRDRPPVSLVSGILDLRYIENTDVAFDGLSRLSLHVAPLVLALSRSGWRPRWPPPGWRDVPRHGRSRQGLR